MGIDTSYICYLDLLGIRETAKFSTNNYFKAMQSFLEKLIVATKKVPKGEDSQEENGNFSLYFFSDCCFIESKKITVIFDYLKELRKKLLKDEPLFFSAAISIGNLQSLNINSDLEKVKENTLKDFNPYIDLIDQLGASSFLNGTIFQSPKISKVYLLQSEFKGSGIFIDPEAIETWKKSFEDTSQLNKSYEKYISESFYFPSIHTNTVKGYYDLKFDKSEMDSYTFKTISKQYYYSNAKNKKYGRFYLPLLANWIYSSNYKVLSTVKKGKKVSLLDPPLIVSYLTQKDEVISELIRNAFYFEYLYFFLLKKVYEDRKASDDVTQYLIENVISKNIKCKKYLTKIDTIPDSIMGASNKHNLIEDYHTYLHNKNINGVSNK